MFSKLGLPARVGLLLCAGLLGLSFVMPLWKIGLWAPQYPEGLQLYIWANKFTGDVQTVNILNHYVGMAPIKEDSFPELQLFPKVFLALMALCVFAAVVNRAVAAYLSAIGLVTFALWAFIDFYRWEVRFGTELNPDAAIKMDDMVYQPPLIGDKQFLNITASSWPALAGWAFAAAVLLALVIGVHQFYRSQWKSE